MLQAVSELEMPESRPETFGIPSQVVVYDANALLQFDALQFLMIAKPLVADGSTKSHKMSLVYHKTGLLKLKPPLVLQEFINHGEVIFKIFVVGDFVKCVRRKSLPDVSEDMVSDCKGSMTFSQVSNLTEKNMREMLGNESLEEAEMPPVEFVMDTASGLRRVMGLNLFSFDMIKDAKVGNHYFVIDINYFPGYAKMPSYENVLSELF